MAVLVCLGREISCIFFEKIWSPKNETGSADLHNMDDCTFLCRRLCCTFLHPRFYMTLFQILLDILNIKEEIFSTENVFWSQYFLFVFLHHSKRAILVKKPLENIQYFEKKGTRLFSQFLKLPSSSFDVLFTTPPPSSLLITYSFYRD